MRMRYSATAMGLLMILIGSSGALAVTDITQDAEVKADPDTVKAIRATFDRAEEALRTKNLSGIMAIYSKAYRNRGLRKEDTARIWQDIFARYDQLSSRHVFSKIVIEKKELRPATARVTCTGALYGVSVLRKGTPSPTASGEKPIHIDVWFEATHYLVLEDGTWKIIGHDPSAGESDPFAAAIHLLF
jgi:hypothetical protein